MKIIWVLAGGMLLGFTLGFLIRDATIESAPEVGEGASRGDVRASPNGTLSGEGQAESAGVKRNRAPVIDPDDGRERRRERQRRTRSEALVALREALEGGDRDAVHDALHDLSRRGGEPLSAEELEDLGSLLYMADDDLVDEFARALAMSGGAEGVAMVLAFAGNSDLPLDARERVLDGLSRVPREMAETVLPSLVDFLQSGPPQSLQHTAAHAIGNLFGDEAAGTLLGLLADRPGIPAEAILDAIGDTGRPEDSETLLGMLSGGWNGREKQGLLRAIGRISTRAGDPDVLLSMMREPPEGISKLMVADAISDSAHQLGTADLREALLEVSGDRQAQERLARALVESGGRAGLDALLEIAKLPGYELDGRAFADALHESRSPDSLSLMMDMFRRSDDGEVAESLAWGMFENGGQAITDELMGLLESGNESQRRAIAHTLEGAREEHRALDMDRLLAVLRSEKNPEIGSELARSLSQTFGERGFEEVAKVLRQTPENEQRHALMWGLEEALRRDRPQARELFIELARSDPAPDVRRHAVEIIQHRRDSSMLPALEQMLRSETDPGVQEGLREAIEHLSR